MCGSDIDFIGLCHIANFWIIGSYPTYGLWVSECPSLHAMQVMLASATWGLLQHTCSSHLHRPTQQFSSWQSKTVTGQMHIRINDSVMSAAISYNFSANRNCICMISWYADFLSHSHKKEEHMSQHVSSQPVIAVRCSEDLSKKLFCGLASKNDREGGIGGINHGKNWSWALILGHQHFFPTRLEMTHFQSILVPGDISSILTISP